MQNILFDVETRAKFPSTRYQGSKLKYISWIWNFVKHLDFETVLDAFGGTGSIAYKFKQEGKVVTYNDILNFNSIIGSALIENDYVKITDNDLKVILAKKSNFSYPTLIKDTFQDIYYTDEENEWLDIVISNIHGIENKFKKNIAFFALFQSCIIKRPYNLFHRKNLYIRQNEVKRSFGNKTSWDTPFEVHFKNFVKEANEAVFSNGKKHKILNNSVFNIKNEYDLVYFDSPYVSDKGIGTDYLDFYHFLEGIVNYDNWKEQIDFKSKHKKIKSNKSEWSNPKLIETCFQKIIAHFSDSIIVISYRSDGIPSINTIVDILQKNGKAVSVHESSDMKYALSVKQSSETLIIAQ